MKRQLGGFIVAGATAFVVDAGVLSALTNLADMSPVTARSFSFTLAVMTTWLINRQISFQVRKRPTFREFYSYFSAMILGAIVNWGVYLAVIHQIPCLARYPAIALIPATLAGMVFNFLSMKFWIFRRGKSNPHARTN